MTSTNIDLIHQAVDTFNKSQGQIGAISPYTLSPVPKLPPQPFTKMSCSITAASAQDDDIYFTYTASGTHTGEFKGLKPTNKTIQWEGWAVATIVNGKIARVHVVEDDWAKLLKLGLQLQLPSMSGKWTTHALGIQINLDLKQDPRAVATALTVSRHPITGIASALGHSYPVTGSNDYPSQPNVTVQSELGSGPENLLKFHGDFTGSDANHVEGKYSLGSLSGSATLRRS